MQDLLKCFTVLTNKEKALKQLH